MVGDVIQITQIPKNWWYTYLSLLDFTTRHTEGIHQLATHVRQLAVGDEIIEIIRNIDLATLINGIAKFGKLTNKILARRFLRQLMICCEMQRDITCA